MKIKDKRFQKWINWMAYIVIVYACIPNRLFAHIRYGEDPSWQFALNTAIHKNYVFGTDFVFTYGPLGFLSTALPLYIPDHGLSILLYKTVLFAGLAMIGIYAVRLASSIWQKAGILAVFFFAGRLYNYESSVYFMGLFLALLYWHQKHQKDYLLFIALAFACLNFYIKLNTGFLLFGLLGMYTVLLLITRRLSLLKWLGLLLLGTILMISIARITNTNLPAYCMNGFEIVSNFSAAQAYPVPGYTTLYWAIGTLLAFLFLIVQYLRKSTRQPFAWLNCSMLAACLFVAFKQGFVRGSYNHQISFFSAALLLMLVFLALINWPGSAAKYYIPAVAILFFCGISILQIGIYGFGFSPLKDVYTTSNAPIAQMPARIKEKIGNSSVDIIPFEAMHFYYNKLNYTPRPIPQGYQAYSDRLDSINADYFQGDKAPGFVMIANGSIDNRHPFWDEIKTKLIIRKNYNVDDSLLIADKPGLKPTKYWLLQKKQNQVVYKFPRVYKTWNQDITDTIDCSGLNVKAILKIGINDSWRNKVVGLLFKPAVLSIHIRYQDGSSVAYKAINPMLNAGIPLEGKLQDDKEISLFLRNLPGLPQSRISAIWLSGNVEMFDPQIQLQLLLENATVINHKVAGH